VNVMGWGTKGQNGTLSPLPLKVKSFIPDKDNRFSLYRIVETVFGAHTLSYPMGARGSFPVGVKLQGREAGHAPPTCAEFKKTRICRMFRAQADWTLTLRESP
jgi:hypothetical protein